ncbi:MAG: pyridoxamine 5'-phosphate oxidase family protein [Candidatus Omnitrophica bacterium]|nr:pyridoxamine 5'-phosphate oxidase family protein [Candidatus Omnitrophota bacterium]
MRIPKKVVDFLGSQSFVIVSTLDKDGSIHNSCKGVVGIDKKGVIYLLDLYKAHTYKNLKSRHYISITAVDEDRFEGYCLKGKAEFLKEDLIEPEIIKLWDTNITRRITNRIIKTLQGQKSHSGHPEVNFPKPKYLIKMKVEKIVSLAGKKQRRQS